LDKLIDLAAEIDEADTVEIPFREASLFWSLLIERFGISIQTKANKNVK